ncbi:MULTISPECIES: Na+/H+ antiporter NhaC [unclassified Sedimentibacter]|uniref:Na+/H+ antiporter NhaC n=1 Tax=unclassified Sedimentibacter TaxID=2649220 RepID=UPI0027E138BC|nr:Na+/H+ antiporter NhaC [Sedimentibacter sp. MB35-C1]WMJ77662.1 Na+/H+ antiporter NhaC [Sedimentibacter sp. MB35-C1]
MKKSVKAKRKPKMWEALLPLIAMLVIVIIGKGVYNLRIEILMLLAAGITSIIAVRVGVTWDEMLEEIASKIHKSMGALLLLIIVGTIIGSWMASGTIPMLIYYGVQIISPRWLLVTAFLLCAIVSVATGSSWSSVSTVGVAIIGIATGFGSNLAAVAGAVVAGSYFGDKMSPLSDTTNLSPLVSGGDLYEHIKHMFWTTIPSSLIGLVIYAVLGLTSPSAGSATSETVVNMINNLDSMYNWNIIILLPMIIVLAGSIMKMPSIPVMLLSSLVASIEAIVIQGISISNVFIANVSGFNTGMITMETFNPDLLIPEVIKLLNRGGMMSIMGTILLILCAFGFSGILSSAGCLEVILNKLTSSVKTEGGLILSTVISTFTLALTTGSVHLTILIPGELFKDIYAQRGLAPENLSRTLEDAGTVTVPLIPWSSSGAYMTACLGVATMAYLPWAFMCYLCIVFAIIYGYTGIGIKRNKTEKIS